MDARSAFEIELRQRTESFLSLSSEQIGTLYTHYCLLLKWNRVINLTRITSMPEAVERHYGEALYLVSHLPTDAKTLVDIGSGAGFPGFPIAVARPEVEVTLVESDRRKATFLRECSDLAPNMKVAAERAENLKGSFDWATARAVSTEGSFEAASRLARKFAFLAGADARAAAQIGALHKLPWGEARFLWIGDVPRGTPERQ